MSYRFDGDGAFSPAKLWAGGVASAVVAALVAIVGILIVRGVLGIGLLAPSSEGLWGDTRTATYAVGAAVLALLATGLLHILLATTPRGVTFFSWILFLLALVGAALPFTLVANLASQIATAALNFIIAIAVMALVGGSGDASRRPRTARAQDIQQRPQQTQQRPQQTQQQTQQYWNEPTTRPYWSE